MEPMALGSPVGSPSGSDSLLKSPNSVPNYLPGFLMGDTTSTSMSSSRVYASNTNVPKYTKLGLGLGSHPNSPPSFSLSSPTPVLSTTRLGRQEKVGGPPVQKLFHGTPGTTSAQDSSIVGMTPVPSTPHLSFGTSIVATPVSTATTTDAADTWVTIFGFPPSAASFILTQAAQWGHVNDHRVPPQGNWMHLKFASKLQAKKALTKNGKIFGETLMIGVVPCTDNDILDEARKENIFAASSTPVAASASRWETSLSVTSPSASTNVTLDRSGMRPLTQAFKVAHSNLDVVQRGRVPQENTSIITKAMDYVFGW